MEALLTLHVPSQRRIEQFLRYDKPPSPHQPIDTILVLGTSQTIDKASFDMRIALTLEYAKKYPTAAIMFSGKRPHSSHASPHEFEEGFVESAVMAEEAMRQGLQRKSVMLEKDSTNTRENILFSLNQLPHNAQNLLILCSSFTARRVSLYLTRMEKDGTIPRKNWFIVDADVRRDAEGTNLQSKDHMRIERKINYEWDRLRRYRRLGHL